MNIFDGRRDQQLFNSGLPQVPLRSPQGAACYQVGKHTFPLQRPCGALREAEKAHWIVRRNPWLSDGK